MLRSCVTVTFQKLPQIAKTIANMNLGWATAEIDCFLQNGISKSTASSVLKDLLHGLHVKTAAGQCHFATINEEADCLIGLTRPVT